MQEETEFPGLWSCPGYKNRLNNKPPFRYECDGMELTSEGAQAFEDTLMRVYAEKTARNN